MQSQRVAPQVEDTRNERARVRQPVWRGATGLCAVLAVTACGPERSPWLGFPLFPEAPDAGDLAGTPQAPPGVQAPAAVSGENVRTQPVQPGAAAAVPVMAGASAAVSGAPAAQPAAAGAPSSAPAQPPAAFRITELYLRDPHIFVGTSDITDTPVLGMSVNRSLIPNQLGMDADRDGNLDASLVLTLSPFDALAMTPSAQLSMSSAKCPAMPTGPCTPEVGLSATWTVENRVSGACLAPAPMTTSAYTPPVAAPSGPCFVATNAADMTIDLGGIEIQVIAARVGATYQMQPRPGLVQGLIAGFVTNAAAMAAVVPTSAGPPVGGSSLSTFVRQRDHDLAASPTMQDGFWMYLNFVAEPVQYEPR
jgi:hypothetical protein